jgi:hypothetical protein
MIQYFGMFNLFYVSEETRKRMTKIIVDSLIDDQLEVRLSASLTLTGFIHSCFLIVDMEFIVIIKYI